MFGQGLGIYSALVLADNLALKLFCFSLCGTRSTCAAAVSHMFSLTLTSHAFTLMGLAGQEEDGGNSQTAERISAEVQTCRATGGQTSVPDPLAMMCM